MATTTTKLALTKPDGTDLVDIAVLNANADKLDTAAGALVCTSGTRPATPWNGQLIYETDTSNILVYKTSTTSWVTLGGSTVAATAPANAGNGSFWWDSDNGKLYIYYADGNSSQWVAVSGGVGSNAQATNVLINGAFDIWQRGTTGTYSSGSYSGADRWVSGSNSTTISRDTDVPSGVSQYSLKIVAAAANSIYQRVEAANIASYAGQAVTLSFYYKRTSGTGNVDVRFYYPSALDNFGTVTQIGSTVVLSTTPSSSWTRYSTTVTLPSNVANGLQVLINNDGNTTSYIAGVQLESGYMATTFKRNQPNIQAELATCQRYYYRNTGAATNSRLSAGVQVSNTTADVLAILPVDLRIVPTTVEYSNVVWTDATAFNATVSSITTNYGGGSTKAVNLLVTFATNGALRYPGYISVTAAGGYLGFSAEL